MIKNFEEVKKQLAELSEVVNKFKSEAVQLRIVELAFAGRTVLDEEKLDEENGQPHRKRTGKKSKATANSPAKIENKRPRAGGKGPKAALEQFIGDGFFNQKRTIGAVVEHCKLKARNYRANELSGPLGRLVRDDKLSRAKNAENQFEYTKK
jgi:hypothetical protein